MFIILYNPGIADIAAFCPSSEMKLALSNSRGNLFTIRISEDIKSKRLVDHDDADSDGTMFWNWSYKEYSQ